MSDVVNIIKEIGQVITPIALAWIAYKQVVNAKKVDNYKKEVDGKMGQLLEAKKAEGHEAGMKQQKEDSASTASETVDAIKADLSIDITKK